MKRKWQKERGELTKYFLVCKILQRLTRSVCKEFLGGTTVQYLFHTPTKEYATKELKVGKIISPKSDTKTPFREGGGWGNNILQQEEGDGNERKGCKCNK